MKDSDEFLTKQNWDFDNMESFVPKYVGEHIRNTMNQSKLVNQWDNLGRVLQARATLELKSDWKMLRNKGDICEDLKQLWYKDLPFKFSFLAWSRYQFLNYYMLEILMFHSFIGVVLIKK